MQVEALLGRYAAKRHPALAAEVAVRRLQAESTNKENSHLERLVL
jgi:hypothetical protein